MSNFQHPGDEMILPDALKAQVEPLINQYWDNKHAGSVGYLQGIPTARQMLEWKDTDNSMSILRDTVESRGAAVQWNGQDRSITVTKGSDSLSLKIGESAAVVNGKTVQLPYAVRIENGKTVIPTSVLNGFLKK